MQVTSVKKKEVLFVTLAEILKLFIFDVDLIEIFKHISSLLSGIHYTYGIKSCMTQEFKVTSAISCTNKK